MGDDNAMDIISRAIAQLALNQERQDAALSVPCVRAINCKSYQLGQDWGQYASYFRENVRAAYGYAHGDAALDDACCSWIGSKLAVGPTMTAYEGLFDAVKGDWDQLNTELSHLYINEEEKQGFLSDSAWLKRGTQSLMVYKNELISRVNLYQPELKRVPLEYQRQLVDRFISGLDDEQLRRKLRFHCRRERMTIEHAYEYAVDYESTEAEAKAKGVVEATEEEAIFSAAGQIPSATGQYFVPRGHGGGYLYDPSNASYSYYPPYYQ